MTSSQSSPNACSYNTIRVSAAATKSIAQQILALRRSTLAHIYKPLPNLELRVRIDPQELSEWENCQILDMVTTDVDNGFPPRGDFRVIAHHRIDLHPPS